MRTNRRERVAMERIDHLNMSRFQARYYAFNHSEGDYVLFIKENNYMNYEYLEKINYYAQKYKADLLQCREMTHMWNEYEQQEFDKPSLYNKMWHMSYSPSLIFKYHHWLDNKVFRRDVLQKSYENITEAFINRTNHYVDDEFLLGVLAFQNHHKMYITGYYGIYYYRVNYTNPWPVKRDYQFFADYQLEELPFAAQTFLYRAFLDEGERIDAATRCAIMDLYQKNEVFTQKLRFDIERHEKLRCSAELPVDDETEKELRRVKGMLKKDKNETQTVTNKQEL